jgi:hypothetical protein
MSAVALLHTMWSISHKRDFFLFPKVKMLFKGKRFQDTEEIKRNATTKLLAVPRSQFQKCFGQWKVRWNKCVLSEGDYLEGY